MTTTAHPSTAIDLFKAVLVANRIFFIQASVASLLINLLALSLSLYSMQVYDRVIPSQGLATLIVLTGGVLLATVLEWMVKLARSQVLEVVIKDADLELSRAIFLRLLGIRMDQFPNSVGTLSAQLRSYETIRNFGSAATLFFAVDAPFALLFVAVIGLLAGPMLATIPLVFFVLALTLGLFYRGRIARHAQKGYVAANQKLGLLVETVEGAENLKAAGGASQQLERWEALNRQSMEDELAVRRYSEQASYSAAFIQQASYIALIAGGAWLAATSTHLTIGGLIACTILSGRALGPVAALPALIVQWAHAKAALDSLEKVFALESDNHAVESPLKPEIITGQFEVAAVRFTYPGRPETLHIERLQIRAGEKIAILGPIGAGKSTLLKLLAGLYAPAQGRVLLDGLDIQQIDRSHLSRHLGYLPQEVKLIAGSLRANLQVGLVGVGEQAMLNACRVSGLATLVASHPKGLDLDISEGGRGVSGGQKQLLALTRLLLATPSVWLLDEPTAAMDELTEQRSLAALRSAIEPQHSLILVTHKPTLLRLVDRLIVLAPNGVVTDGPRDVVLRQLGESAKAAQQQAQTQQSQAALAKVQPIRAA